MRAPEKKIEKPAEKKIEKKVEKKAEEKPAPRRSELAVPKSFAEAEPAPADAPSAGGGSKLVWLVAALALAAILGGGYMLYPGFHKAARVPTGASDTADLGLRVEHSGPDLLLTWNRDSYGAKNGKHGVLQVFDGESHQNYDIDREALTSGLGVVYSPQTQDVSFQMSVTDEKGVEIGKGGQRVLHPRPSPMDDPKAVSASNKAPATPAAATKGDTPADTAAAAPPPEAAPAAERATRKFDQASLANNRIRQATPTDLSGALPDAPSVGGAAPQAASLPGGNFAGIAPPPPRAAAPPPPPPTKSSASQISQAVLVYKRDPDYPKVAQQMGQKGVVELEATIGIDGKVKGVKVLKGPPMLQKAAQEAVMQWVYKPTLLNGTPVENVTHISINFAGK
jgi:protein TonB